MLQSPNFSNYRVSESMQFFTDVLDACNLYPEAATQVNAQLDNLKESKTELAEIFKLAKGSEKTVFVKGLDGRRDKGIICLRKFAEAFASHFNEEIAADGKKLLDCIDKYGSSIQKMNYQSETNVLNNLCAELLSEEIMLPTVNKLGMFEVATEIDTANKGFSEVFIARNDDEQAAESISAGEAIKTAITHFRTLADHLFAYSITAPSDSNTNLIGGINKLIEKYNTMVAKREKDNESDENTEDNGAE